MYETHQEKRKRVYVDSLKAINNQLKQDLAIHKKALELASYKKECTMLHKVNGRCKKPELPCNQCWIDYSLQQAREQEEKARQRSLEFEAQREGI